MDLVDVNPAPPAVTYNWGWGGTVTIVTTSGARFASTVDAPRGSAPRGVAWSNIDAKSPCAHARLEVAGRSTLEGASIVIHGFDNVKNVAELIRLLSPTS